jgi:hypothetical protein
MTVLPMMAVNYHGKSFITLAPGANAIKQILQ